MQAELVQPRQLPDGLLEVTFEGRDRPDHVLVEIATYPEKRALLQALDDLSLARQFLKGVLPEMLMLVLRPRGRLRITGQHAVTSRLGWAELGCKWKVVELWEQPAETLLAMGDVGVVPWVPLAKYDGPPEALLTRCRERIHKESHGDERRDLLAVSQVMAQLRFPQAELLALLERGDVVIKSPLIEQFRADVLREAILDLLKERFGEAPAEVRRLLEGVKKEKALRRLNVRAGTADSLEAFRDHLLK